MGGNSRALETKRVDQVASDVSNHYQSLALKADMLPVVISRALKARELLVTEIRHLEEDGLANATPWYRDQKYLYLIYPTQANGERIREYIGADEEKKSAALRKIERYRLWTELQRRLSVIDTCLDQAHGLMNMIFAKFPEGGK